MLWSGVIRLASHPQAELRAAMYRFLRWLPLPATNKWAGTLHLMRLHIHMLVQLAAQKHGPVGAEVLVAESLHEAGKGWIEKRLVWAPYPLSNAEVLGDTWVLVMKTLNLPSRVTVGPELVTVTTFFCPFLEDAKRAGEDRAAVCERICGEYRSLFKGMSDGFPVYVRYSAPDMMGRGATACVKELDLRPAIVPEEAPLSTAADRDDDAHTGGEQPTPDSQA